MRLSADVTPRRFPPPWIVDETDALNNARTAAQTEFTGEKNAMLGRRSKNSAAAIRATTTHARLEALELTLLAVLPLLPPASRAIVRSNIAGFMDEDITTAPASLVPTRHAQLFRDTLRGQMQAMIEAIDRAG